MSSSYLERIPRHYAPNPGWTIRFLAPITGRSRAGRYTQTPENGTIPENPQTANQRFQPKTPLRFQVGQGQQGVAGDQIWVGFQPAGILVDPGAVRFLSAEQFFPEFPAPIVFLPLGVGEFFQF